MNSTIETMLNHRSIRKFKDLELSNSQVEMIVKAAQSASTSSHVQAYSIIGVTDMAKKRKLAEIAKGQKYVEQNGHFFVFCADLHRHEVIADKREQKEVYGNLETAESFMVAVIDAALAAQNAAVAAESMGLGICYIGGLRNDMEGVADLLGLPQRTAPLFGMAVGYPDQDPGRKPRLPAAAVYHENEYMKDREKTARLLDQYDREMQDYYIARTGGKRKDTWSGMMAGMFSEPKRTYIKSFLKRIGFPFN
ncbi:oxygen-insensitive NADPH nitroreductase [Bacillus marinisedimentorum]|uniref:oxygen-insensitive NADPH nitroreductase n=1 Tax=Bacillus marinisedimentorum TaxID=1821260 RepID=UPI000872B609|nr:oxygen-insensitive NADPH nitroreductase [Bacillus marinisedimentorum]